MDEKEYFSAARFRDAISELIVQVWRTPYHAANDSGLYYQDLQAFLNGNKKLLRPWQINVLLTRALFKGALSETEYQQWYQRLHKELIFLKTVAAWFYNETDKRIDPQEAEDAIAHNPALKQRLESEFVWLEEMIDKVFRAGGATWSVGTLAFVLRKSRQLDQVYIPADWQVWALDTCDAVISWEWPDWDTVIEETPAKLRGVIARITGRIVGQ